MKLGILLSAHDPEPEFVWVPCPKTQRTNPSVVHDSPAVDTLLGLKKAAYPQTEKFNVGKNEIRGYTLDHAVVLSSRENWLNDGSKPNQAALALTDWKLPYVRERAF